MSSLRPARPEWADVIEEHAVDREVARRLIAQLLAAQVAALAFCRLLERWGRGDPDPSTPGRRQAAAADRHALHLDIDLPRIERHPRIAGRADDAAPIRIGPRNRRLYQR